MSFSEKIKQDIDDYPVQRAVYDVISYHETCSFMYGLQKALDEGTQTTLEARKAKLEQYKRELVAYIASQGYSLSTSAVAPASTVQYTSSVGADLPNISGAVERIKAIEQELLSMIKVQQ